MRTIVDVPVGDLDRLAAICKRERISRAEAVRRAVTAYVREHESPPTDEAFGLWRERVADALDYEDAIRGEWQVNESPARYKRPR